jgi:hypothetical protein
VEKLKFWKDYLTVFAASGFSFEYFKTGGLCGKRFAVWNLGNSTAFVSTQRRTMKYFVKVAVRGLFLEHTDF